MPSMARVLVGPSPLDLSEVRAGSRRWGLEAKAAAGTRFNFNQLKSAEAALAFVRWVLSALLASASGVVSWMRIVRCLAPEYPRSASGPRMQLGTLWDSVSVPGSAIPHNLRSPGPPLCPARTGSHASTWHRATSTAVPLDRMRKVVLALISQTARPAYFVVGAHYA